MTHIPSDFLSSTHAFVFNSVEPRLHVLFSKRSFLFFFPKEENWLGKIQYVNIILNNHEMKSCWFHLECCNYHCFNEKDAKTQYKNKWVRQDLCALYIFGYFMCADVDLLVGKFAGKNLSITLTIYVQKNYCF